MGGEGRRGGEGKGEGEGEERQEGRGGEGREDKINYTSVGTRVWVSLQICIGLMWREGGEGGGGEGRGGERKGEEGRRGEGRGGEGGDHRKIPTD